MPASSLELAELGFEARDSEPAVTDRVISRLRLLDADAEEMPCADVLAVSELQSSATEALELSYRDFLTGLHNRRHAEQEADRLLAWVREEHQLLSMLVIDVDDFKTVNDVHLHVAGDEVLKRLGELLLCSVRKSDVVCRFGGDEFVILMPSTRLADAESFAKRLCAIVTGDQWGDLVDGLDVSITCGAAQASDDSTFESLFATADERMLEAKSMRKRGPVESYDLRL